MTTNTPKTKQEIKQFILDTLLPYKQDPSLVAIGESGLCEYLTHDGRKCALGKHMKDGQWQKHRGDVQSLTGGDAVYKLVDILTDEAKGFSTDVDFWNVMQLYHDSFADGSNVSTNNAVAKIENFTNMNFPELLVTP